MRGFVALLLLLCVCTGAQATQTEPFNARLQEVPSVWFMNLRAKVLEEKKDLITLIVEKVKTKPKETQPAWVSQLVNLSRLGPNNCAPTAIVELAILFRLHFEPENLRYVKGFEDSTLDPDETHAVAAVRINGVWWILENHHLIADYRAVPDTEIKSSFHALETYK